MKLKFKSITNLISKFTPLALLAGVYLSTSALPAVADQWFRFTITGRANYTGQYDNYIQLAEFALVNASGTVVSRGLQEDTSGNTLPAAGKFKYAGPRGGTPTPANLFTRGANKYCVSGIASVYPLDPGDTPIFTIHLASTVDPVVGYNLRSGGDTSGNKGRAPVAWTIETSQDGSSWDVAIIKTVSSDAGLTSNNTWYNGGGSGDDGPTTYYSLVPTTFLERLAVDPRRVYTDPNATGGDIILHDTNGDYIHVFSMPGTSTFTLNQSCSASALLVGGGGAGGQRGGGGGAGGFLELEATQYAAGSYSITVGAGGKSNYASGSSSSFNTHTAGGGGAGGWQNTAYNGATEGKSGACGGGSALKTSSAGAGNQDGNGGGNGANANLDNAGAYGWNGGGGGAGASASEYRGGSGLPSSILGFEQYFAGGGGGGMVNGSYVSGESCGNGGGGNGSWDAANKQSHYNYAGESGMDGLGGGGGGGGGNSNINHISGGCGGSGIVIIRVTSGSAIPSVSTLTVTLSGSSATYTGSSVEPNITVKDGGTTLFSGIKASDITGKGFTAQWKKGGSAASVQNAGTYTLVLTGDETTYTGTAEKGTFTVDRKQIAKPTAVQNLVYNGSQQTGVASGTGYTVTDGAKTSAGDYTASVSLSDKTNTEWADTHATADQNISWSIAKKSLTVTATINGKADNTTAIKEGSPAPTYGVQYSAFASGESASNLTTQPTATSNYTTTSPQGTYTVTPSGGVSGNYEFNYVSHTFQVTPAAGIKIPMPKPTQRTFKEVSGKTYTMTFEASDADGHFTVAGTQSASAPGVYQLCVTPKQNYCWEDDESVSSRTIEWGILPSNYTEPFGDDRNFLKTLVNHPNRVSGGALPTGITGGDIILRFPNRENGVTVSHDYVHIFTNETASFNNETGVARPGRALIVGGGGGGGRRKYKGSYQTWGFDGVGGGGGGGGVRVLSDMIWDGEFSVTVGKGGASDSNGSPSSIVGGGASYEVLGGGHGGCGSNDSTADPDNNAVSGGSGGGGGLYANHSDQFGKNPALVSSAGLGGAGSLWGYSGSAGKAAQITTDSAGKVNKDYGSGGGGGGAGCGAGVTAPTSSGAMGAVSTVIDGRMLCFGGGGAGGRMGLNSTPVEGVGGFGGGGGNKQAGTDLTYCQSGVDGLGGGGSGRVGQYNTTSGVGRSGGSGLVAIRYTDDTRLSQIKTVAVPRELLHDRPYNFNTYSTGLVDTDDYTVEGQLEGRDIGTYTVTLKLKYPDDSEWDDGTDQPQVLTWKIVPEVPISSDFYLKLCSNSNRVERDILQMGAPIVFRWKETDAVSGQEYNHYVNIFTDCVNSVQFELKEDLPNADILLVGGGGGGGGGRSDGGGAGGGGGGGGVRCLTGSDAVTLLSGSYTIDVGLHGQGGGASWKGGNGGASAIKLNKVTIWDVDGGGGGGGSAGTDQAPSYLPNGGGGGGAYGVKGGTSSGASGGTYGYPGGGTNGGQGGGAGGGAGASPTTTYSVQPAAGGNGKQSEILGIADEYFEYFGGGGAGGWGPKADGGETVSGGKGGGGESRIRKRSLPGMNGQGGGGAGGSCSNGGGGFQGENGGDGIVIIAYTALSGSVVAKPQMNSTVCRYDGHEFDAREFLDSKLNLAFSGTCTATDVGTYTFEVTPAPGYHWLGTEEEDEDARDPVVFSWTIEPRVLADFAAFSAIGPQTYSGQDITPAVTLTDATWNGGTGKTLVSGTDYTLEYVNNRNIGTATVKATGKGNYTGAMSTTFQIVNDPTVTGFYVTPEGGGDGTGWASPCTLAEAVGKIGSATQSKVAIYMKEGDYDSVGSLTVNASSKQVSILGGYKGENMNIVSGGQSVLSGGSLTITAGQAVALSQLTFAGCAVSKSESAALTVEHCAFRGISGYALTATAGSVTVASCSFSGNTSGSLSVSSGVAATVRNSILYSKTSGGEISNAGTLTLDHVLLSGAHSGGTQTGVITGDPLFASATDLHLQSSGGRYVGGAWQKDDESSPAIDAGEGSYNGEYANDAGQNFGLNLGVYGNTQQASKSPVRTAATVTFDDAGGTGGPRPLSGWAGYPMPASISTPARAKFTFGGYFTGENGAGDKYYNADGSLVTGCTYPAGETTLYACWSQNAVEVILNPNGGTGGTPSVQAMPGQAMPTPITIPTREGYTFQGYSAEGWEVTKMTGSEADILTTGTKIYAYSACEAITLNGVEFTATLKAGTTSGSVTFNPGMACADSSSGNAGKGDATAYGKLMKNKVRNDSGVASLSVTLGGLTENHAYLVQLICHEGNVPKARGLSVDGHAYNCCQYGEDASQYGRSFVRCFKATSGSYSFTLGKVGDYLQLNALQVREIGGEDDSLLYYNADGTSARTYPLSGGPTELFAQWEQAILKVKRPTQGTASWTYDGQDHSPSFADTDGYTVTYSAGAPWKDAGTYTVTFTLKPNCEWADGEDRTSPIVFTYEITQREVTLNWGSTSLTYNKTAQAPTCTAGNLVSGDSCTVTVLGQKTNVGTGYTATATGLSDSNYKLPPAKTTTFSIVAKQLTVSGLAATSRPYDGTTTVAITGGTLNGVISGDTVTCEMPRSGTIADANVGTGKPVTYLALTLGGSSAGNYSVTSPSLTVTITQAENVWTTTPAISKTTYKANDPATLTPGVARFGTVAATIAKDGAAATTFSGALPTDVGSYELTYSVAGTANYTGLTATLTFTVTGAAYDLHAISATGPVIKDVPSSWLAAAFPSVADYQDAFLSTNVNGVTGWAAYILGFEGGDVPTAAIIEKTTQSTMSDDGNNNVMLTIALSDLPKEEDRPTVEGCTVAYSLLTSTDAETLRKGGGDIVDGCLKISSSSFTVPLSIPTDANHVYYRIRIHFIFAGGGGDNPELIVVDSLTITGEIDVRNLPVGWVAKGTEDDAGATTYTKGDFQVISTIADIPENYKDYGYIGITFSVTSKFDICSLITTYLDEGGKTVSDSGINSQVRTGFNSTNEQEISAVYRIPPDATCEGVNLEWRDSNAARVEYGNGPNHKGDSNYLHKDTDFLISDVAVELFGYLEAASRADAIFTKHVNQDAWNAVIPTELHPEKQAWTRNLSSLKDALTSGQEYKILMMGDSTSCAPQNGCVEALIKRQWPNSNIKFYLLWQNNSGCYHYAGLSTKNNKREFAESFDYSPYDLIIFSGISQTRDSGSGGMPSENPEYGINTTNAVRMVMDMIRSDALGSRKNTHCQFLMMSSLLSVDSRGFGTSQGGGTYDNGWIDQQYYASDVPGFFEQVGKPCPVNTAWDIEKDIWAKRDYLPIREAMPEFCKDKGIPHWDFFPAAYQYLYRSGKYFQYYSRDAVHPNVWGYQVAARLVFEAFKLVAAHDYSN